MSDTERESKAAEVDCPSCGSDRVVMTWGDEAPAKVECQRCGYYATSNQGDSA